MYSLYHNKEKQEMKIRRDAVAFRKFDFKEEITNYNSNNYLCKNKKPLKELANKIKSDWIKEKEEELYNIKSIVIK